MTVSTFCVVRDLIFTEWLQCLAQNWCHYWPGGSRSSAEQQQEFHYKQVSESWFTAAASCCRMLRWFHRFLPADCCVPRRWQVPTTGGRGADTGLTAAQPLRAPELRKQRVVGSIPGRQSPDFSPFERRFEAAQPEMTVPVGQTPPASNPPLIPPCNSGSPGRPILHGALRRSDTKQLPSKKVPRFLPLLSLPQGKKRGEKKELRVNFFPSEAKNNYQSWTFSQAFLKSCGLYYSWAADLCFHFHKMDNFCQRPYNPHYKEISCSKHTVPQPDVSLLK